MSVTLETGIFGPGDGGPRANGRDLTLPDGQRLFLGGSAPDQPE
ncbi:MAG TPA: hypothetical protein VIV14_01570 [Gammaproteobacteria bacterium]